MNAIYNIHIRQANIDDLDQLRETSRKTFYETFSVQNSEENIQTYMEDAFSYEKLASELIDPGSEFYFAEFNSKAIGYLKLNTGSAQTELQDDKALEIERIYVWQEFQGKRVGQMLYEYAVNLAGEKRAEYIWLGVWEENAKAIKFYKKNGFAEFDKHVFRLGADEQTDIMMKLDLTS